MLCACLLLTTAAAYLPIHLPRVYLHISVIFEGFRLDAGPSDIRPRLTTTSLTLPHMQDLYPADFRDTAARPDRHAAPNLPDTANTGDRRIRAFSTLLALPQCRFPPYLAAWTCRPDGQDTWFCRLAAAGLTCGRTLLRKYLPPPVWTSPYYYPGFFACACLPFGPFYARSLLPRACLLFSYSFPSRTCGYYLPSKHALLMYRF